MGNNTQQFGRICTLIVENKSQGGIDLSALRIKFAVKRSDTMTPNVADIRVYNLDLQTAILIKKEFTRVTLQAGYEGNYGVIFQGNIKQVILGRENATDTFIDIVAGDGDRAYNFAVVNATIAKGSSQEDQAKAAMTSMSTKGVNPGYMGQLPNAKLPRGKVMYGNAKNYLRDIAESSGFGWSIQDEKINFVKQSAYLPGERVVLNSKTGMIGTPQQTNEGVNMKCLLNPKLKIAGRVEINNASVEQYKINLTVPNSPANIPAPLTADGVYYILVVEHVGDTRGTDWYSNLVTLNVDVTSNPLNSVQINRQGQVG